MKLAYFAFALSLLLSSVSFAASEADESPKGFQRAAPTQMSVGGGKTPIHSIKLDDYLKNLAPEEVLEKFDSQGKGDSDIFIVFEKRKDGTKVLRRQLFDLNHDKKIDLVKFFEKGRLVRVEEDLDYDGKVDVISEYDPVTKELKKKTMADGATSIWKYYIKNELRKKEIDRNSDGKPDMWIYYRNGKVTRTEIDQNFDGKVIRVEGPLNLKGAAKSAAAPDYTAE